MDTTAFENGGEERNNRLVQTMFFLRPHRTVVHAEAAQLKSLGTSTLPVKACPCFSPVKGDSEIGLLSSREVPTAARELSLGYRPQMESIQTRLANQGAWNGLYIRRSPYFQ